MGNSSSTDVAEVFGHVAPALGDAASGIGDLCLETARDVFWGASPGNVHMVACALDHREDEEPASFTAAAGGLCSLAHACGVSSLEVLFNERATLLAVRRALQQVVSRCGRGDTFVFYFGGHCKTLRSYDLSRSVSKIKSNELKALEAVLGLDRLLMGRRFSGSSPRISSGFPR
uniref:Uncharacterized protein n=1 Tax=Alexandrium andersonii TaxID=327968 RepID=A0A7S2B5B8_9DINO|mmetsp:Transcript_22268/g.50720  ORF Transcript_22268/g.50720 Transcript_22268/m.50720 type:complete len:174 (+) Transcript_22268:59-580(+)